MAGGMKKRFALVEIVRVDRGRIAHGQHIPYISGAIVVDRQEDRVLWLDGFNSEVLLKEYWGYNLSQKGIGLSLENIYNENREFLAKKGYIATVKNDMEYIEAVADTKLKKEKGTNSHTAMMRDSLKKCNNIEILPRSVVSMQLLARDILI